MTSEKHQKVDRAYQVGGDHYTTMRVQPWDVIDDWPIHDAVAFYRGNALKYIMRFGSKDAADAGAPLKDARKAQHYIRKLIETLGG